MIAQNLLPEVKLPRAQISMALKAMVDDGTISLAFKGGGNVPHRYTLKNGEGLVEQPFFSSNGA